MGRTSQDGGDGGDGDTGDRRSRGGRRGRGRGGRGRARDGGDGGEASRASVDAVPNAAAAAPPGAPFGALRATSTPFIPRSVTVPNRGIAPPGAPAAAPLAPATKHRASRHRQRQRPKREGGAEGDAPTPADDPRARDDGAAAGEEAGSTGGKDEDEGEGEGEGKGKGKGKGKGTGGKPDGWWRDISTCDPITLEPLADLNHPPFELRAKPNPASPAVSHLFDPTCLAEWVTGSKTFENPLTRAPMDATDCRRLDNHLRRCRLPKFAVHDAFVAAAHERRVAEEQRAARANESVEAATARREREASELAASLFMSIRARERRSGNGRRGRDRDVGVDLDAEGHRRRRGDAFTADGAFAMVDDDEGMRGRRLGRRQMPETERWVWEDGSHLLYDEGDDRDGVRTRDDFPALGGVGGAAVVAGVPEAEASFPSLSGNSGGWAATAARARSLPPPPSRPPVAPRVQSLPNRSSTHTDVAPGTNTTDAIDDDDGSMAKLASEEDRAAREERRKKLADAFGVADPDSRPSSFAASSASFFAPDVLATARLNPDAVDAMESALERLVLAGADGQHSCTPRRVRLDPMPRRIRAVAHALAATYGATSCSYGDEPRRRVDYFRSKNTQFPSVRLSDALRAVAEGGTNGGGSVVGGLVGVHADAARGNSRSLGPAPDSVWFPGYTEHHSRGRWSRLEVRFTDFNDVHVALAAVREFTERGECACELVARATGASEGALGGSGRWSEGMDLVVHFWKRSRYESAVGKLGGGIRGRFRATHACEVGPDPDPDDDESTRGDGKMSDKLDATREALRAKAKEISGGRVGPSVPGAFGNPNKRRETPMAADPWADDSVEEWNGLLDDVD